MTPHRAGGSGAAHRCPRRVPARSSSGATLIDALVGVVILSFMGVSAMGLIGTTGRGAAKVRADLLFRSLVVDVLDRQASGQARSLLSSAPATPGRFARDLDDPEWRAMVSGEEAALLASLAPRFTVSLEPERPGPAQQRYRFGRITCTVGWDDPNLGRRLITLSTVTDAL
ncbi:MAG: hypothetical protein HY815_18640 [Candidatus Riflebacteria bacterium]|nr:hypothetical protein [Candidatus Riflebacteria bacterium]